MTNFSVIHAIAFDLDGTLVDSIPGLTQALDQALYSLELPVAGQQRVVKWVGNGADVLVEKALTWALQQSASDGQPDLLPQRQQLLRQLFDRYYQSAVISGSELYPGVADTLQRLRTHGLPLALVTNKPSAFIVPLLTSLGIADHFCLIIGGDDVIVKKPHPAAIYLVLGKLGLLAQQLLFVGDSRNDILAAQAAGCPCIGMSYGYNHGDPISQNNPTRVLAQFTDLLTLPGLTDSNR